MQKGLHLQAVHQNNVSYTVDTVELFITVRHGHACGRTGVCTRAACTCPGGKHGNERLRPGECHGHGACHLAAVL